jgi:hypothetical protein
MESMQEAMTTTTKGLIQGSSLATVFHNFTHYYDQPMYWYVCVCVCVCVRARARVRACARTRSIITNHNNVKLINVVIGSS